MASPPPARPIGQYSLVQEALLHVAADVGALGKVISELIPGVVDLAAEFESCREGLLSRFGKAANPRPQFSTTVAEGNTRLNRVQVGSSGPLNSGLDLDGEKCLLTTLPFFVGSGTPQKQTRACLHCWSSRWPTCHVVAAGSCIMGQSIFIGGEPCVVDRRILPMRYAKEVSPPSWFDRLLSPKPSILCHTSAAIVTLDPCTPWAHVDVGTGPQYPPPRFSNMVPTTHTTRSDRFNGSLPVGGTASAPEYHDDEFKALRPQDCPYPLLRTTLHDPVAEVTTVLHHQSRYLQVWTGALTTFGVDAVVLEPLSAMSDSFNNHDGVHILSAGEQYTNVMAISLE